VKDFQCEICGRAFASESSLTRHLQLEHPANSVERVPQDASIQAKLDALTSRIRALEIELADWRSGRKLLPFDAELHTKNPDSAPRLEAYVKERIQALSKYEVLTLAEKHKLLPIQDDEEWAPDEGIKLRAYLPTGG